VIDCHRLHGSLLNSGGFSSAHIRGPHVPAEGPSTASTTEVTNSRIFYFASPMWEPGASSLSSLRLLQLSGALRASGHPVWPRASPSSRPIPRVWSRGCARHIPGHRPVRHEAGPCRDMGARFRTPSHAHQPTSRAFRMKPIAHREFRPGHSRYRPQAHAHSHHGSSRHDTICCSPP
jgi:hypothetical protein